MLVIDGAKKLRLTLTYPASTGRNFAELLRTIDSLQLTDKHRVATPADWRQGEDVIIVPAVDDGLRGIFSRRLDEGETLSSHGEAAGLTPPRSQFRTEKIQEDSP